MKITNLGVGNPPVPLPSPIDTSAASGTDAATPGPTAAPSHYSPSPELQRYIDLARSEPDIRPERVQAALARLQQGDYHTSASNQQTADAILANAD